MATVDLEQQARLKALCHYLDQTAAENRTAFNPRFRDWLLNNFSMYVEFAAAADKVWDAGIREYSPYVIVNVLRFRANVRGIKFSMTNTLIPDIARLYNAERRYLFKTSTRFGKETS